VIVSRRELIEKSAERLFRIPEIYVIRAEPILRESVTTNLHATSGIMKRHPTNRRLGLLGVHPSNFKVHRFTDKPSLK